MVRRDHLVGFPLNDQDRQRRQRADPVERPVAVVDGQAERPLQRPGRPEVRELLARERAVAGERALDDQRADVAPVGRCGEAGDRDRAAEALAEHHDPLRIDLGHGEQRLERGREVEVQAVELGRAGRAPVAAVVEQQDVEAGPGQPGDARDVGADVLGVAVQEQDAALARRARRQEPAVQADAVGGDERDVAVGEADLVGGQKVMGQRVEDQPGAACEQQGWGQDSGRDAF